VDRYPQFYWNSVSPYIQTAIRYLNVTSSGRQWIATHDVPHRDQLAKAVAELHAALLKV